MWKKTLMKKLSVLWHALCHKLFWYGFGKFVNHKILLRLADWEIHVGLLRKRLIGKRYELATAKQELRKHRAMQRLVKALVNGEYVRSATAQTIKLKVPRELFDNLVTRLENIPPSFPKK